MGTTKVERHVCFDAVDAQIGSHNRKLTTDPKFPNALHIETSRIRIHDGQWLRHLRCLDDCPPVIAAFCPFCGEQLDVSTGPKEVPPTPMTVNRVIAGLNQPLRTE